MPTNVYELNIDKVDMVSGGDVSVVIVKEYIGVPVTIGGYGFAVWGTEGSVCGSVITPKNPAGVPGHCS